VAATRTAELDGGELGRASCQPIASIASIASRAAVAFEYVSVLAPRHRPCTIWPNGCRRNTTPSQPTSATATPTQMSAPVHSVRAEASTRARLTSVPATQPTMASVGTASHSPPYGSEPVRPARINAHTASAAHATRTGRAVQADLG
jgi:hypothetical protein